MACSPLGPEVPVYIDFYFEPVFFLQFLSTGMTERRACCELKEVSYDQQDDSALLLTSHILLALGSYA